MRVFSLLFIGDVVGHVGLRELLRQLPSLKEQYQPDCLVVNGENIVDGKGLSERKQPNSLMPASIASPQAIIYGRTGRLAPFSSPIKMC